MKASSGIFLALGAGFKNVGQSGLRTNVAGVGGFAVPGDRLVGVLADAAAGGVHDRHVVLRERQVRLGRLEIPLESLFVVLGDALALIVHPAQFVLRDGQAAIGGGGDTS